MVPDVAQTCTLDLKQPGNLLYVLGTTRRELGGSYYARVLGIEGGVVPQPAEWGPRVMRALHQAMRDGLVAACHDCSDGGLSAALAEMCIAGRLGASVSLNGMPVCGADPQDDWLLFSESGARFVVEVASGNQDAFERSMRDVPLGLLGQVTEVPEMVILGWGGEEVLRARVDALCHAWRGHLDGAAREAAR